MRKQRDTVVTGLWHQDRYRQQNKLRLSWGKKTTGGLGKEVTKTRGDTSPPPNPPGADTAPVFGVPPWPPPLLAAAPGAALLREQLRDQGAPRGARPHHLSPGGVAAAAGLGGPEEGTRGS